MTPPTGGHHHGTDALRGGFAAHASPPVSPRAAYRQPARRSTDHHNIGDLLGSSSQNRAPSIYSQSTQNMHQPPLPHHPQAHFYGAPELDFGVGRRDNARRAGASLCCTFDRITPHGTEDFRSPENTLLVGVDHGLEVFHVDKKRFDRIGRLSGLRGSAIGAKIVPPTDGGGLFRTQQPLVIVIIHGPHLTEAAGEATAADNEEFDPSGSMLQALQGNETDPSLYETSVDVYSLKTGSHIQTLFRSPMVEVEVRPYGPPSVPLPVGDLEVQAKGRFIIISCGKSGEVYVFETTQEAASSALPFRCIGKVWTQTDSKAPSRSTSVSSASDSGAQGLYEGATPEARHSPHADVSLSSRWLAIVPPAFSTQITLHGVIADRGSSNKIHGVSSHTSPSEPPITCQLDTPEGESYLNKAVRDASQTFIKGARWVGDQGMQAWNNYWKPELNSPMTSPPPMVPPSNQYQFPPTHAQDTKVKPPRNTASLVSILDLEKLSKSQNQKATVALQPLATFSLPNGCSFVSFSPDGLKLLTASAKGDVQQVWDLMRMIHGDAVRFKDKNPLLRGPTVREVARFPRMTEAKITDVIWTEPRGSRLAIFTAKGTAHVFDMPQKAFQWPPPRQAIRDPRTAPRPKDAAEEEAPRPQTATSSLTSAFSMLSSTTSSTIAAVRGRRPSSTNFSTSFGGFAGAGAQSGKAVATTVNRSVSAAAVGAYDTLRHLGENRVTLPLSATEAISPGHIHWLDGTTLGVTAGGLVRIYSIGRSRSTPKSSGASSGGGRKRRPYIVAGKPTEFAIPRDSASSLDSHGNRHFPTPQLDDTGSPAPIGSFWRHSSPHQRTPSTITDPIPGGGKQPADHPLSHAELTTSAAYQPFHTDRRVSFYVYNYNTNTDTTSHRDISTDPTSDSAILTPSAAAAGGDEYDPHHLRPTPTGKPMWVFGEPIARTRVGGGGGVGSGGGGTGRGRPRGGGGGGVGGAAGGKGSDADEGGDDDDDGGGGVKGGGVVVTSPTHSRRRRGGEEEEGAGDGDGEIFEDDVQWVDFSEERV